jgi:hypothetical protein
MWYKNIIYIFLFCYILISCRDPYEPTLVSRNANFLVVEGYIAGDNKTTNIRLSRLNNYEEKAFKAELGAIVTLEGQDNSLQRLNDVNRSGNYTAILNIATDNKYRLRIKTSNGKEYLSDPLEVIVTPEIEDLFWKQNDNGITIMVNTRDPKNETKYYRWEYEETWTIRARYFSAWEYKNGRLVERMMDAWFPTECYNDFKSTNIVLASTAHLAEDNLRNQPILDISTSTPRLNIKYSILVKQYGLNRKAFQFWQNIQKNTENMGSIFDPQPTQLPSNIKCITDPSEMVVGFISAGHYKEKRIFISRSDLPAMRISTGFENCLIDTVDLTRTSLDAVFGAGFIVPIEHDPIIGLITSSSLECADCSRRGSPVRPPFWE